MTYLKSGALLALFVLGALIPLTFAGGGVAAGPPSVDLGTATSYAVLAGDTITNTGPTTIDGDLGLHPGSAVVGAPTVTGSSNVANGAAQQAKADLRTAYLDAEGRSGAVSIVAGALGGRTLTPGLYEDDGAPASLGIAGGQTLTLDGDASSVWIFQSSSTLIAEVGSRVVLTGGAQACNVFWQVGSSATLRTGVSFVGTVMAHTNITAENSAVVSGRLLAGAQANGAGALTLDTNTISRPSCTTTGTTTTGATTTGATTTVAPPPVLPPIVAPADVGVVKTASPTAVAIGDSVTYTSVITNNGPGVATGVSFRDALPAGTTFVSATTTQGSCSGTQTVVCSLGQLDLGQSATVVIVVRATSAGTVTNTAGISAQEADQNVGANNSSTAVVQVAAPAAPVVVPPAPAPAPAPPAPAPKPKAAPAPAAPKPAAVKKPLGASTSVQGPALPPVNPVGFTG